MLVHAGTPVFPAGFQSSQNGNLNGNGNGQGYVQALGNSMLLSLQDTMCTSSCPDTRSICSPAVHKVPWQ